MRRMLVLAVPLIWAMMGIAPPEAESACCYFSAKDKDVLQPAQKAFITWDPVEKVETFTVQPKFEGNAADFGMVIPTPSRPKLDEMPRDFFKTLAIFTILEPMDISKYKPPIAFRNSVRPRGAASQPKSTVKVLEAGIVGTLDYKIIQAERADDLYSWLKDNRYSYAGDEATLDHYIKKAWFFTVMKIDPMQTKKRADGSYEGEVTPTRFAFASEKLVYPLKITQISVKDKTEALFYVQAPQKMDLPGEFSHQFTWVPMWSQATGFALTGKLSEEEVRWQRHVKPRVQEYLQRVQNLRQNQREPATLEWAKKITDGDIAVLEGKKAFNRQAPKEEVEKLKLLKGHVQKGQFITKMRKVFTKREMDEDLEFVRAAVAGQDDNMEYYSILPTSPP